MSGSDHLARDRDVTAVSAIFADSLPQVYGYLLRRCGSRELAEDLTSTAFTRATSAAARGQVETVTTAWIVSIARNLLIDHWRREAVASRTLHLVEDRRILDDPWSVVIDAERARALLSELRPEHRLVLTLRYLDDLAVRDVAELLDRTVRATESLLLRARRSLRDAYEASEQDTEPEVPDA